MTRLKAPHASEGGAKRPEMSFVSFAFHRPFTSYKYEPISAMSDISLCSSTYSVVGGIGGQDSIDCEGLPTIRDWHIGYIDRSIGRLDGSSSAR